MITLASPLSGWVTRLERVPDPVFAERMLGDGVAVDPTEGRLVAPASGIIETVHEAGHAVTLALDGGPVLLMHIGLDTVGLGGEGFSPQVQNGQRVEAGDTLILFDLGLIARRARSLVTPVIVTNGDIFRVEACASEGPIEAGQILLELGRACESASAGASAEATVSKSLTLLLAHGLHARPAARLSKAIGEFDSQVEIVSEDGRVASARSPVAVLGLGLRHGASIVVRASGPEAEPSLGTVVELLESGMGELQQLAADESLTAEKRPKPVQLPQELRGIAAVPGLAMGPAWRVEQDEILVVERADDPVIERSALKAARDRVEAALEREAQGGGTAGGIAEAHLAMIADPLLDEEAQRLIASGKSAAFAWQNAVERLGAPLRSSSDPRFQERLDDLIDLERRVLVELTGEVADHPEPPKGAILVAEALYPSQLKSLAESGIAGIASAAGGATSHAAIIAAGLGLPMIVGLGSELALVENGTPLILKGDSLAIAPDEAALERASEEATRRKTKLATARKHAHELAVTSDGTRIEVFANLGSVAEANFAVAQGAEGCGLLRTEFLFLDRVSPPSESEQREAYQSVSAALGDRPLIVRTLDIGADKPAAWLPMESEDNPALGLRGIRLQLARRDLLETQLRALLGVSSSERLRIMLPMVSNIAEVQEAKECLRLLAAEMRVEEPALGIMVETPAAAMMSRALAAEASFFSIGTNDLSQYALARDRTNPAVAAGLDPLDPSVLRLIDETVRGANVHDRVTGVCGGLAAIPEAIPVLLGLGITELSVPAGAIAEIKAIVRALDLALCREVASKALSSADSGAVRALVEPLLEQRA